jgi:hypothetical protein
MRASPVFEDHTSCTYLSRKVDEGGKEHLHRHVSAVSEQDLLQQRVDGLARMGQLTQGGEICFSSLLVDDQ